MGNAGSLRMAEIAGRQGTVRMCLCVCATMNSGENPKSSFPFWFLSLFKPRYRLAHGPMDRPGSVHVFEWPDQLITRVEGA